MKKLLLFFMIFNISIFGKSSFKFSVAKISKTLEKKMRAGKTYKKGCPIPLKNLRYIKLSYLDIQNKHKTGELIVHKDISKKMVYTFKDLYNSGFNIERMNLIHIYGGNDRASMGKNNTSAFNCRNVAGTKRWSRHAFGKAIDVNPFINPFVKGNYVSPKKAKKYKNRSLKEKGMIIKNSSAYKIFKKYAWKWGGDWKYTKDYQHFFINN